MDNEYQDDDTDELLEKQDKLHNYFKKKLSKKDYTKLNELLEMERELTLRETG